MKLKSAFKYQLYEFKKPMQIYYLVIYLLFIFFGISTLSSINNGFGGMEYASIVFIFICGLNSFKDDFKMFLQNGLSRKTLFISFTYSMVLVSVIMALIDSINGAIASAIFRYDSMYMQLYQLRYTGMGNGFLKLSEGLLWYIFAYAMVGMVGFFITVLYYRMNKGLKLLVSIGVPSLIFVVLPMYDSYFTKGAIFRSIGSFFSFAWGYKNGYNPYFSMVTCTLISVLFGTLSYLLIKNAQVKE